MSTPHPSENETPPRPKPRRRRRTQRLSPVQIILAAVLSVGLLLVINFSGRLARRRQMAAERQRLQATIGVLETQHVDLLKARDYAASDRSVEHWAHTEGKMVREGEVLVIPIPAGLTTITPTAPPPVFATTPEPPPEVPPWHLWWRLFFDSNPPF